MSKFLTALTVTEISDSIFQVVDSPFQYQSDLLPGIIVVPVGFYTDFASILRIIPLIYALLGDTAHEPAVIHDWLYYSALTDRKTADEILAEAMRTLGMASWRCRSFYAGVRTFGWIAWNQHRKDGHPEASKFPIR